mgnify:CR=1 FL=1
MSSKSAELDKNKTFQYEKDNNINNSHALETQKYINAGY